MQTPDELMANEPKHGEQRIPAFAVMPGIATVLAVETCVNKILSECCSEPSSLTLDFSESTYIEIASLQYVTALVCRRKKANLETRLKLPAGLDGFPARSMLRRWNYPAAIRLAAKIKFEDFVVESDHQYFQGNGGDLEVNPYARTEETYDLPSGPVTFTRDAHRFFEFATWDIEKYLEAKRLVIDAYEAWDIDAVRAVLNRNLQGPRQSSARNSAAGTSDVYLASRVFYEAITNAVRHPGARVVQTSSHLDTQSKAKQFFTIVFWDDGKSMLRTIANAIDSKRNIRRPYPKHFDTDFELTKVDEEGNRSPPEVVKSCDTPVSSQDEERLLLATLYPGTTCNIDGVGHHSLLGESGETDAGLGEPGMGLFVLISTAIDMFGGSVAFRTDRFFMNVKAKRVKGRHTDGMSEATKYSVKIQRFPAAIPSFLGNMVTVRLPLGAQ
ncbi:hypothetical protein [Sulfuritalea sp.]|uniref:hypothetical protein n=1 Tax=Sulfuritalea sp. TaxID=2480090 RepID=UPI001AC4DE48|nr:hypothetical protein [Sulfuritalea sp.]MBN8476986.1 hypothetical protein [Sulfuritalea sp.]